jgi:hypothetical protein
MEIQPDLWEMTLTVAAPLLLALVEIFHPHPPHDLLRLNVQTWLLVHYAQTMLFPLSALAVATLVHGQTGIAAMVCRISMFLFAIAYTVFDTAAGIVTGILVKAANLSATPDAWRNAIDAVWLHPIVGGAPAPLLAIAGSVALSVGAIAAAVVLKRRGVSWGPLLLLTLSTFGIAVFKTHAWPGGPITFGGIGLAAAWLQLERSRRLAQLNVASVI